ncbi:MAG: MOSC domain-containing protein [Lachnospiraceae bacterium]|nr:MOSC domain-containing protein [Lachnospiraceae bacterium]
MDVKIKGKLVAVCLSAERGTGKKPVQSAELKEGYGIVGDAHAGSWHRQISLLPSEEAEAFKKKGAKVSFGDFGENLVTAGIDWKSIAVGSLVEIGNALLEISQLGKNCHSHCKIYEAVGECIMPREGVFAEVLKGGIIRPGDEICVLPPEPDRPFRAGIITLSDSCAAGEREDESGPLMKEMLEAAGYRVIEALLLPDGREELERELIRLSDRRRADVVFTSGGTGFSERDLTPEATLQVSDREAPGIGEALRAFSMNITKNAMFSRQSAGIRGSTLIINLPGSPKAVKEELEFLLPALPHALKILRGETPDKSGGTK